MYSKQLKILKERENLSQQKIANIIGIERGIYSLYETEKRIIPLKHLVTLCNFFGVSLDFMFDFTSTEEYENTRQEVDRHIRKSNKFTQEKFAELWNLRDTTVSAYEKGKLIISTPFLYYICKNYGISADYLLGRTDTPVYLEGFKK